MQLRQASTCGSRLLAAVCAVPGSSHPPGTLTCYMYQDQNMQAQLSPATGSTEYERQNVMQPVEEKVLRQDSEKARR